MSVLTAAPAGGMSTSQGHPRTVFGRALEHDNLVLAEVTAREIGRVTIAGLSGCGILARGVG